jgi:phospholipase A1
LLQAAAARAQGLLLEQDGTAIEERAAQERSAGNSRFAILAHKPNYFLPATYTSSADNSAYNSFPEIGRNLDKMEVKFQLSFKIPLYEGLLGGKADIYAAYSQLALWQAYNARISAPFRETNYEPEAFITYRTDLRLLGAKIKYFAVGFNHQSNGQIQPLSRSWNRVITGAVMQKGHNYCILRQWTRMPERAKDDDNPHIERYLGYGDIQLLRSGKTHSLGLTLRNNLRAHGNKGAVQLDWTFPLHGKLRGYMQLFNGYGETLISYNRSNSRAGLGVILTEWI